MWSAICFSLDQSEILSFGRVNFLSDMPILDFSNSAPNKGMMSKIWTYGNTII